MSTCVFNNCTDSNTVMTSLLLSQVGDINRRCVESLGGEEPRDLAVSFVRNVATNKDMMRASFRLTADILLSDKCTAKKRKLQ